MYCAVSQSVNVFICIIITPNTNVGTGFVVYNQQAFVATIV